MKFLSRIYNKILYSIITESLFNVFKKRKYNDDCDFRVKYFLKDFLEEKGMSEGSWLIHLIYTETLKKKVVVTIYLGRPGVFIGVGGSNINEIKDRLSELLGKPVEINIKQYDVFR